MKEGYLYCIEAIGNFDAKREMSLSPLVVGVVGTPRHGLLSGYNIGNRRGIVDVGYNAVFLVLVVVACDGDVQ